ncbi:MAG: helix-turn-helix transcriptional regulator [Bacilli bacterium]|nr:helix-turn-helix transcriptional regulator [Bacilli bacterium]
MYTTDKLKAVRIMRKLTIYDMAKKLGISAPYYYQIENKQRKLSYEMAYKIAIIFNLKPDDLFYI